MHIILLQIDLITFIDFFSIVLRGKMRKVFFLNENYTIDPRVIQI